MTHIDNTSPEPTGRVDIVIWTSKQGRTSMMHIDNSASLANDYGLTGCGERYPRHASTVLTDDTIEMVECKRCLAAYRSRP